jgi:hypothetical protein
VPTLLVTRRMSPALAARVQAAVSGPQARRRSLKSVLRILTFAFVIASVVGVLHFREQRRQKLEAQRAELQSRLRQAGQTLTRSDRELPARAASAIALEAAASYPGDLLPQDLRSETRLSEALSLPTLYVRGPLDALGRPERVSEVAASSSKDAFVLCLLAPPEARSEKALRLKASAAYNQNGTQHIERLAPLLQALPLLGRDWAQRIESAETALALQTLHKLVEAAPLAAAVRAAKARQLLLVLDETGAGTGPTELDGERAHPVRVVLTDLVSGAARLRYRQLVDPTWLSDRARAQYASGIDSCALAMDLRRAATAAPPTP